MPKTKQNGEKDSSRESKKLSRRGKIIIVYYIVWQGREYVFMIKVVNVCITWITIDTLRRNNKKRVFVMEQREGGEKFSFFILRSLRR